MGTSCRQRSVRPIPTRKVQPIGLDGAEISSGIARREERQWSTPRTEVVVVRRPASRDYA